MAAVDAEQGAITTPEVKTLSNVRKGFTAFADGDVLFAKITPCMENGKAAIANGLVGALGFGSTEFHVLRPKAGVSTQWIFHFIRQTSFRRAAQAHFAGTAGQLRVPSSFLESYEIPLPQLPEQHRIVTEIEKQFTRLDAGVAALRRVQANLKRYRASVLKAACEGRLAPQDPNDEPAERLLARILAERRARWEAEHPGKKYVEPAAPEMDGLAELPAGWCWATVDQLGATDEQTVLTGPFGTNLGSEDFRGSGVPVLTIGCLTDAGLELGKAKFISPQKALELKRYQVRRGDLLFSRMATVGRAGLVTAAFENSIVSYHLMRLRLAPSIISSNYFISYVRGSAAVRQYVQDVNHGATRDGINTQQLMSMPVSLPPLSEQSRIVAEVERRLSVVAELEATVAANLARAGRLRQAVLKRAFEGRLVVQDAPSAASHAHLPSANAERLSNR